MVKRFFIVAVEKAQPLIGLQTCRDLELISINNTVSEVKTDSEILDEYQDVFTGLGLVDGESHIEQMTQSPQFTRQERFH